MGAILSSAGADVSEVTVTFEGTPPGSDVPVCNSVAELMQSAPPLMEALDGYKDCSAYIRKALSASSPATEGEAFQAVKKNVAQISQFFNFSKKISQLTREVILVLGTGNTRQAFTSNQGAVKALADILDFVLRFDEMKMMRPGIQNDFSYYRRVLGKHLDDPDLKVRDEEASFISLFIAQPIPMMTSLAKQATAAYKESPHVPAVLAMMANVCQYTLKEKKFESASTGVLCARAMVGAIVLFDHSSLEGGAFIKRSGINIKECVKTLVKQYSTQQPLIGMLKFSTIHYQDESTPSSIRSMLEKA